MRLVVALAIGVGLALAAGAEAPLPWTAAGEHVGELVLVEGFVRRVERDGRRLTFVFDPDDPHALRVTLLIPLVTDLPPAPEALYDERRIVVQGRVIRTAGHLEIIVTDPDRVSITGLTPDVSAPDPANAAREPVPVTRRPTERRTPPATTVPRPPSPAEAAAARAAAACERLRASRDAARREALAAVATLRRCLEAGHGGCVEATDAIAPPVTRLEWIEQDLRARCHSAP